MGYVSYISNNNQLKNWILDLCFDVSIDLWDSFYLKHLEFW